jgi:hypothetical protein
MFELRIIAILKRILFGMIALALALAPVQAATSVKADAAMSNMATSKKVVMARTDCPQKKNYHCPDEFICDIA